VLSQFCRECKVNNAVFLRKGWQYLQEIGPKYIRVAYLFYLTFAQAMGILEPSHVLTEVFSMPDEKLTFLRQSHTLHPHPERVRDPLFTSGSPFFDARDLVQVKYELLRRVRVDGYSVSDATSLFALSRPTFYAALSAWERAGLSGLLPVKTGPREAHKLTDEIMRDLLPLSQTMSSTGLASWLEAHRSLIVHPRSIERALKRAAKKGGTSS
jgi:transposase